MATAEVQVTLHPGFHKATGRLGTTERGRVMEALCKLAEDPTSLGLHLEPLKGVDPRLHSARASQDIRILLARVGQILLALDAGPHDELYTRARRKRVVVSPSLQQISIVEVSHTAPAPPNQREHVSADAPTPERGVFDHWTDDELLDAGVREGVVTLLRSCADEAALSDAVDQLTEPEMELVFELLELTPEQWAAPSLDGDAEAGERFRQAVLSFGAASGLSPLLTANEIAQIAAAPIEEWMIFLHPDQRAAVDRTFDGPARVRGAAGTGKSVVGLHRARRLAAERADGDGPILYTTFIKTLPPVFENLYQRMPGAQTGEVVFKHVDSLAARLCNDRGQRQSVKPKAVDEAFKAAWRLVVLDDTPLHRAGISRSYLRDEIQRVIKGRGLDGIDEYLRLQRTGRRTPFSEPMRRQTWELHERWDEEMRRRGTVDFPDVVRRARDLAQEDDEPQYRAAIVDEAQDLTLVGLQLVDALSRPRAGARTDHLLIVGDAAQRIYAGGFSLRQAGFEVRGRTTILRQTYRNTQQILDAALAVAGQEAVDDFDDTFERGEQSATSDRAGVAPSLVQCESWPDEMRFISTTITDIDRAVLGLGDIAVLVPTKRQVQQVLRALDEDDVPCEPLEDYDGISSDRVKVGTFKRAKGLEFKVVFIPGLAEGGFPRPQGDRQADDEYAEQRSMELSELFVAMTRARDGLFLLHDGQPPAEVARVAGRFETI